MPEKMFVEPESLSNVSPDDFPAYWFDIATPDHFWFKARMRAFLSLASKHTNLKHSLAVLEIGCGNGLVRRQIEAKTNWITDGADITSEALKRNTGLKGRTMLYNIHDRREELKEKYDVIMLFDVLEHIPDTKAFLESCLFYLKPGGLFFLNVPALNRFKSVYDEVVGHIRRYDKQMMQAEFSGLKAQMLDQRYWALSLVPPLIIRKYWLSDSTDIEGTVKKGLQPANSFIDWLFDTVLAVEHWFIKSPKLGASLLTVVKKTK